MECIIELKPYSSFDMGIFRKQIRRCSATPFCHRTPHAGPPLRLPFVTPVLPTMHFHPKNDYLIFLRIFCKISKFCVEYQNTPRALLCLLFNSLFTVEAVICKTTWVILLKDLSYCYHWNHQGGKHYLPQEPCFHWAQAASSIIFPIKITRILDSGYFISRLSFRFWP
jgi:hypothetical protein